MEKHRIKTKNILYIGPYREFSGEGNSARQYIEALYKQGHDICISPIFYTGEVYPENDISSEILPLESNYLKHYDIVIQHCHPFDYCYDHKFTKNIGILQFNGCAIAPALCSRLDMMDQIIVNSSQNLRVVNHHANGLLSSKIKVVPELIDIELPKYEYSQYEWIKKDACVFYTIGDMINRKNIEKIILAFLYSFNKEDNVELVIKTKPHFSHQDPNLVYKEMEYVLNKAYRILKKNKDEIKKPKVMVGKFSRTALLSLHHNGHCYIDASKAENFGYSVLEASVFGNQIIVNKNSSTSEISRDVYYTESVKTNVLDADTPNFAYNRLTDHWYDIDIISLSQNMKKVFMDHVCNKKTQHQISKYHHENINSIL